MNPQRFLIVAVLAMVTALLSGSAALCQVETLAERQRPEESQTTPERQTVALLLDFGDDFQMQYTNLSWTADQTVHDVMKQAELHPHPLKIQLRGGGETAFLESIAGVGNEGGSGANWIFYVNGERAERGFGVKTVDAGDTILWKFEK